MRRALALAAVALLAGSACGKYGPPVRTAEPRPTPAAKPVPAAPSTAPDTGQSQDPNAPPTKPPETEP